MLGVRRNRHWRPTCLVLTADWKRGVAAFDQYLCDTKAIRWASTDCLPAKECSEHLQKMKEQMMQSPHGHGQVQADWIRWSVSSTSSG